MSASPPSPPTTTPRLTLVALLALLWLAGLYLRVPVLVAPALAPFMAADLGLSQTVVGALTTLPVFMLAIGALPGSLLIARYGPRNTLVLALLLVAVASAARGLAP
ncbi:MAG: MFS transporter, partial [Halomonadaceae bacterium]